MSETDERLLRCAAAEVRKLGRAATPGPWSRAMKTRTKSAIVAPTPDDAEFWQRDREHVAICSVPHFDGGGGFVRARSGRDLDWIAAFGPQIAEPLAQMLDRAAVHRYATDVGNRDVPGANLAYESWTDSAVDLARLVIGEAVA